MRSILMMQRGAIIIPDIIMFGIMPPIIGDVIPPIIGMFIIGFIAPGIIPAIRSDIMLLIVFIMAFAPVFTGPSQA